jgi:hypothetical protein
LFFKKNGQNGEWKFQTAFIPKNIPKTGTAQNLGKNLSFGAKKRTMLESSGIVPPLG